MNKIIKLGGAAVVTILLSSALGGCAKEIAEEQVTAGLLPPVLNPVTEINQTLRDLPPPSSKVVAAVYNYSDQTGQFKPSETTQTLSKAVTQGATSILIKALQDVGQGSWFTVVERERIDNLLKERTIITQMRALYLGEKKVDPKALPPLLFAGIIFEGGIIGYDSNTQTGGVGARLLGIGGDVKYRLDTITIYLRAVSTKTGQVLASVTTHKTIASVGLQGGVFKYIAIDKILEAEAGFTKNEPDQLAVQQAIEKAVYAIILEGAALNIWSFENKTAQSKLIESYRADIAGTVSAVATDKSGSAEPPSSGTGGQSVASTPAKTKALEQKQIVSLPVPKDTAARGASLQPDADKMPTSSTGEGAKSKPATRSWKASLLVTPPLPVQAPVTAPPPANSDLSEAERRPWATGVATVKESFSNLTTGK
ncbi:MAG: curlin [Rhodomicrobium sp.]|nr:curlin [Rhodomicrobium sp.]